MERIDLGKSINSGVISLIGELIWENQFWDDL